MTDWNGRFTDREATLIDGLQSGFPVQERPFRLIGERLGCDEKETVSLVRRLSDDGIFRRVGPVLNPPVIGSSTLAAIAVPEDRFDAAADVVNSYDQINHNYQREHEWNMWFVVTAASRRRRDRILVEIERKTGCEVLTLPMRTQYAINLEFPVVHDGLIAWDADGHDTVEPMDISSRSLDLSRLEAAVLLEIQDGFELTPTPYRNIAQTLDTSVEEVLAAITRLKEQYAIKRIGCVVNHHAVGFDENCMVVWDVPIDELDEAGVNAGRHPSVTYCCHRPQRAAMGWPYTLFTMIHGRSGDAVDATIDDLADEALPYDHSRLYTTGVLKQTGVRYRDLVPTNSNQTRGEPLV